MTLDRTVTTRIDTDVCIGCGECIPVCPHDTISLVEKKARVTGDHSLNCDHCGAACSTGAITVGAIDEELSQFAHFTAETTWIPHGKYDTTRLVNLMQSRRSCRNFKDDPIKKSLLEDLVKIGVTAPSGSNCQMWSFTLLPDRASVEAYGKRVLDFFERLNGMAEKRWLRTLLRLVGKDELYEYYINYYERIREGLEEWKSKGTDMLFHGAPAVIIVGSKTEASCPSEDALLATQNILLGAHSLGLGTCLIGFAVKAMNKDRRIATFVNIPDDEEAYAVIAVGYPDEKYRRVAGRKPVLLRYFASAGSN